MNSLPSPTAKLATVTVSREIQCDIGHRIPFHKAACAHVHGHRYRIVATIEGPVTRQPGISDDGMVSDFADLKRLMMAEIHDAVDHAFLVWKNDQPLRGFLESQNFRVVVMDEPPTAENFAEWCYHRLARACAATFGVAVRLQSVTIWETPNCCATYRLQPSDPYGSPHSHVD